MSFRRVIDHGNVLVTFGPPSHWQATRFRADFIDTEIIDDVTALFDM